MEYVEVARAESERGELVLRERREETAPPVLELRANGVFVMDTLETSSERALAAAALEQVPDPGRVLVGGLGLGFTMHEVLADSRVRTCAVAEIESALVGWMRDGTVPHGPEMLADARLRLRVGDVADALTEAPSESYDLVLLDVDNGPGHLVHAGNARLYRTAFLRSCRDALRAGGALVIWSAEESTGLARTMREVFGNATATSYPVRLQDRDEHYWLHTSRRAARLAE